MCGIVAAVGLFNSLECVQLMEASKIRGRDHRGFFLLSQGNIEKGDVPDFPPFSKNSIFLAQSRATPTTETHKAGGLPPFSRGGWYVLHNGTLSNDRELGNGEDIDTQIILKLLQGKPFALTSLQDVLEILVGSYALILAHEDHAEELLVACNYKPLYMKKKATCVLLASTECMLGDPTQEFNAGNAILKLTPYSMARVNASGIVESRTLRGRAGKKALVVASAGLDSTVTACILKAEGYGVTLLHFAYGCTAADREKSRIQKIAESLRVPLLLESLPMYSRMTDSPLLNASRSIAAGEQGAEYAHEWVHARNLVLISHAIAIAEYKSFDVVALGNNLEESGAYPDNEPELYELLNKLMSNVVAEGRQIRILQPVGNMMKHEIVRTGHALGAPLHLTWSCYSGGEHPCGDCGPCYMRRRAFEMNGLVDVQADASE